MKALDIAEVAKLSGLPAATLRFYEEKGLSPDIAFAVATELTAKDALKAHAEAEFGIDSENHVSPTQAAISSFIAFALGGALPLIAVTGPWIDLRIQIK